MIVRVAALAVGLFVGLGAATPGHGQAAPARPAVQPARFAVTGTVQDQTGGMLAGATVTLVGPAPTTDRVVKTDGAGRFKIDDVIAGAYELRAEYEGFRPGLARLKAGPRAPGPQKVVLQLAAVTQEVTVGDKPVSIDAAQNRNTITVDKKMLADLPIFDRDAVAALSRFLDPAPPAGRRSSSTAWRRGRSASRRSAIQQIKINQDPYAAEFGRPGQGRIEVTTEAGSEAYHGEFNFTFRDGHLNARNAFETTTSPEQRRIFEGSLSGPIGSGKTTSFLVDRRSGGRGSAGPSSTPPTPTGTSRRSCPTPVRHVLDLSGTVNHQIGKEHTLSLRADVRVGDREERGRRRHDAARGRLALVRSARTQIIYTPADDPVAEAHQPVPLPLRTGSGSRRSASPTAPRIVVQDAFTGGGAQVDSLETERHFTLNESLTWSAGKHLVKGGFAHPGLELARVQRPQQLRRHVLVLEPRRLHGRQALPVRAAAGRSRARLRAEDPGALRAGRDLGAPEPGGHDGRALRLAELLRRPQQRRAAALVRVGPGDEGHDGRARRRRPLQRPA